MLNGSFFSLFFVLILVIFTFLFPSCVIGYSIDLLNTKHIAYIGRFDFASGYPRFDWSGSRIKLRVVSPISSVMSLNVSFRDVNNGTSVFHILIDEDIIMGPYEISSTKGYFLSESINLLSHKQYIISLVKVTESVYGTIEIADISIHGVTLLPVSSNTMKMMFIGDSITVAYGVEGTDPCNGTAQNQNILDSYANLVANVFDADYHVIGWSGKGVVRNYGDKQTTSIDPLPFYYNRTIGSQSSSYWDPKSSIFHPDIIYIMLGSNDYSTEPVPSDDDFIAGLVKFIQQIQSDYPDATIVAACAPHNHNNQCKNIEASTINTNTMYLFLDASAYDGGYGCNSHPSIQTQKNIANTVTTFIYNLIGF